MDSLLDDIRRDALVDLMKLFTGLFIILVVLRCCRLGSFGSRNFIGSPHPFRMTQGKSDVANPFILRTILKVDGNMSWRDSG